MSKLFSKISQGANKLFNKVTNTDNLGRKFSNTARKIDNSVARVGNFLSNTANQNGYQNIGTQIKGVVDLTHNTRNNLEKAIHTPISSVRNDYL